MYGLMIGGSVNCDLMLLLEEEEEAAALLVVEGFTNCCAATRRPLLGGGGGLAGVARDVCLTVLVRVGKIRRYRVCAELLRVRSRETRSKSWFVVFQNNL